MGFEHAVSRNADGTGSTQPPTEGLEAPAGGSRFTGPMSGSWSADGSWFAFRYGEISGGSSGLAYVEAGVDSVPRVYLDEPGSEFQPSLSPDGHWLAYLSDESGRTEVYVRSFPDSEGVQRRLISDSGGREVLWSNSGREIFFTDADLNMLSAHVRTEPTFAVEGVDVLFDATAYVHTVGHRRFDVTSDDQRFLMLRELTGADQAAPGDRSFVFVEHWFEELKRLVPN